MTRAALALATVLLLPACAVGVARVTPDGACEARGVALGRASIAAYRYEGSGATQSEGESTSTDLETNPCARLDGGSGSAGLWGAIGGVVGAVAGWLAAP